MAGGQERTSERDHDVVVRGLVPRDALLDEHGYSELWHASARTQSTLYDARFRDRIMRIGCLTSSHIHLTENNVLSMLESCASST